MRRGPASTVSRALLLHLLANRLQGHHLARIFDAQVGDQAPRPQERIKILQARHPVWIKRPKRKVTPWPASTCQGPMFDSWSKTARITSSPGANCGARASQELEASVVDGEDHFLGFRRPD